MRLTYRDRNEHGDAVLHLGVDQQELINRLADYENAEEQGLLVRVVRCKYCRFRHGDHDLCNSDFPEDGYCSEGQFILNKEETYND